MGENIIKPFWSTTHLPIHHSIEAIIKEYTNNQM
jgi:hypothetical protein